MMMNDDDAASGEYIENQIVVYSIDLVSWIFGLGIET